MTLTSKQRAQLKGLANGIDTVFQVGKGGCSEALYKQVEDYLTAKELIKIRVLETSPVNVKEAAEQIAQATGAVTVQVIGSKIVLYKQNKEEPQIKLVKANSPLRR